LSSPAMPRYCFANCLFIHVFRHFFFFLLFSFFFSDLYMSKQAGG
jgi:hypothetical protein